MQVLIVVLCFIVSACAHSGGSNTQILGDEIWPQNKRVASDDSVLMTPFPESDSSGATNIYLMDMRGKRKSSWRLPKPAMVSKIDSRGRVHSILLTSPTNKMTPINGECDEIWVQDLNGKLLANIKRRRMSHDFDFMPNNMLAILEFEPVGKAIQLGNIKKKISFADKIVILNDEGEEVWSWSVWSHRSELNVDYRDLDEVSFSHANSLIFLEKNPFSKDSVFLLSFRNLNLAAAVEYPSGKVVWQNRSVKFSRQHDASMSGANVLIFDNGVGDVANTKIVEIDPVTDRVVWSWRAQGHFLANSTMGGARKLSNGHLLVSNSNIGHLFEVNQSGEVVWSFVFDPEKGMSKRKWVVGQPFYRAEVYADEFLKSIGF